MEIATIPIPEAVAAITEQLKSDPEYRRAWSANIAMAFKDTYQQYRHKTGKACLSYEDVHKVANAAAEHFLKLLCKEYQYPEGR